MRVTARPQTLATAVRSEERARARITAKTIRFGGKSRLMRRTFSNLNFAYASTPKIGLAWLTFASNGLAVDAATNVSSPATTIPARPYESWHFTPHHVGTTRWTPLTSS